LHYLFADLAVLSSDSIGLHQLQEIQHLSVEKGFCGVCIRKSGYGFMWAYEEETKKLANCTYITAL